ncbi:11473_t:CDS:2, partial [Acaulospora colombiana]
EATTFYEPEGFDTTPSLSASTPARHTSYPLNPQELFARIGNSSSEIQGPRNRLRRPYEIVYDREIEPTQITNHNVGVTESVRETGSRSRQNTVPISSPPLANISIPSPLHRPPSPSPVVEETLFDGFPSLSRRRIPLSQSPLAPIEDRRQPRITSPYQDLFDRLSNTNPPCSTIGANSGSTPSPQYRLRTTFTTAPNLSRYILVVYRSPHGL